MYDDLKGKNAVVTGAGKKSGIGYAIAESLAKCGTNIVIADLGNIDGAGNRVQTGTTQEMEEIASTLSDTYRVSALPVQVDVTDHDAISVMMEKITSQFKTIDILCNNAGASFGVPNAFHTYEEGDWMKTIDVNLHSVFRITRAVLPLMIDRGGSIVNTASRAGKKAGVIMLTKIMALELAGNNIRANAVCPGQVMTDLEKWRFGLEADFFSTSIEEREAEMCKTIPLNRIGQPREVGDLVSFLASDASSYITGQALNITGGQLMEL